MSADLGAARYRVHRSNDNMECSYSFGGPNYREQDHCDGQCRYAPHWTDCDCSHCRFWIERVHFEIAGPDPAVEALIAETLNDYYGHHRPWCDDVTCRACRFAQHVAKSIATALAARTPTPPTTTDARERARRIIQRLGLSFETVVTLVEELARLEARTPTPTRQYLDCAKCEKPIRGEVMVHDGRVYHDLCDPARTPTPDTTDWKRMYENSQRTVAEVTRSLEAELEARELEARTPTTSAQDERLRIALMWIRDNCDGPAYAKAVAALRGGEAPEAEGPA